ncbi:MAG: fasciclin domain-containing protein, partial [Bradymonadia bacterium]
MAHLRRYIHLTTFLALLLGLNACGDDGSETASVDASVEVDAEIPDGGPVPSDSSMNMDVQVDALTPDMGGDTDMSPGQDATTELDAVVDVDHGQDDMTMPPDQAVPDAVQLPPSLWTVMSARGDMSIFLSLLSTAGYQSALEGGGRYTVFAPTDDSLEQFVNERGLDMAESADVVRIIEYHLADEVLSPTAVQNRATIPTVMGESLRVTLDGMVTVLNETVRIGADSLEATNGFIHVLDGVLDPDVRPVGESVMATLRSDGQFSRFVRLLEDFGLDTILTEVGPFTVFAPTNTAIENWERLRGSLSGLRSEQRRFLVERHLIDGFGELVEGTSPLSFAGITLPITVIGQQTLVAGARVSEGPYLAQNGGVFAMSDVIAREQDPTLYDWLKDDGRFTTFVAGLEGCGLNFLLDQDDWTSLITVLAPTDDAFVQYDIMTDNARFAIFSDPVLLGEFMRHHLLANERFLEDIQPLAAVESASGRLLPITSVNETDVFIAGSRIVDSDIILHNGLLHIMDAVISPP